MNRAGWSLVMVAVMFVAVAIGSVAYTGHTQRQSDRRWCSLLSSLDQPDVPATTERGRQVQLQIHDLRSELGCEER